MFTIDVRAMYLSMDHHLGIEGVRSALDRRTSKIPSTDNLNECLGCVAMKTILNSTVSSSLKFTVHRSDLQRFRDMPVWG